MSAVKIKLKPWFRRATYVILSISWLTGLTFFVMNNWITVEGDFGPEKHPMQFKVLLLHGAAAFMMLMIFGSMLTNHLPLSWQTKRLRKIGLMLTSFIIIQTVTAYLLYYLANESLRAITVWIHLSFGLCIPLVLGIHVVLGKRRTQTKLNEN